MRINKFIATNSEFSRRKADKLIQEGKVFINGKRVSRPGIIVDAEKDTITISGKTIRIRNEKLYIALHKPAGFICTRSDEQNRKTIMDLVPKGKNLKPVGRLDQDTEGLIILTNDGELINRYTHPKFERSKEYIAKIKGQLTPENKKTLEKGIIIDTRKTAPAKITIIRSTSSQTTVKISIREGRNRQIRKMFAKIGQNVKYLKRIRVGKIPLGSLKKGNYRTLNKKDLI